ncbi:MAG: DUF1549 and DUF1553 domain-containing protein [Pirellulales bacterium]
MKRSWTVTLFTVLVGGSFGVPSAQAGDTAVPISERFANVAQEFDDTATDETPDFRRHVLPLLGRLGCNGRACHGSFQGQGGFRLSLFGYDFKNDHEALSGGDSPRVNRDKPAESLILRKPTLMEDHEGGKRYARHGWEYRVLHRWIAAGAKPWTEDEIKFERLEITLRELVFRKAGETAQLKVIAHWSDGTSEDVTPIARFRTNDEAIAKIDESGKVTALGVGDTHVVAFYDNGVAPVPVLLPVSDQTGDKYPLVATPTKIDELVIAKLRKLAIVPSEATTDAEFLRRVSLDITGTLPPPAEIAAFAVDPSPDKRARKIDELLERPAYAAWWATRLSDLTGNNPATMRTLYMPAAEEWYRWIYQRLRENKPYDEIVEGLVLSVSRKPGQSYEEYCRELSTYYGENKTAEFTDRETMPHYWARLNFRNVDDRVTGFSYSFMGIQIQCAQCHKHPFDQWTKDDFDQFKPFFARVRYGVAPGTKEQSDQMLVDLGLEPDPKKRKKNNGQFQRELRTMAAEGKAVPHQEVFLVRGNPAAGRKAAKNPKARRARAALPTARYARLLGGETIDLTQFDDERKALMDWLRNDPKRYFARAIVNRVWANYFNVGIVQPTDDMNLANPPRNAELLDYLANGFIEHGYDLKWLHRQICNSQTYQRSWKPNETNKLDNRNFSRAVPRRLPAEVAYDAVVTATAGDEELEKLAEDAQNRAIGLGNLAGLNRGAGAGRANYALAVFGRPARAINCDCERSAEPSLLQTIYLQNDQETLNFIERRNGWVKQTERALEGRPKRRVKATPVALAEGDSEKQADDDAGRAAKRAGAVREAYLRTLSREPTAEETTRAVHHIEEAASLGAGLRDVMWALINTKEFIVNH